MRTTVISHMLQKTLTREAKSWTDGVSTRDAADYYTFVYGERKKWLGKTPPLQPEDTNNNYCAET